MKVLSNQNGFTYILALTVVMIMGIMLGMVGQSWKSIRQRELEEELLFRGDQVGEVIYQRLKCSNAALPPPSQNFFWPTTYPEGTVLDKLVKTGIPVNCMGGGSMLFRLRPSAAIDPFTNSGWELVTQNTPLPAIATSGIPGIPGTPVTTGSPGTNGTTGTTGVNPNDRFYGVKSSSPLQPIMQNFSSIYKIRDLDKRQAYSDWQFTWKLNWNKR